MDGITNKLKEHIGMNENRRKRQAEIVKITKPWRHSTGPRTPQGKRRVAQNALKHGLRGGIFRQAEGLLALNSKILKEID
jgi:hypothetical protein